MRDYEKRLDVSEAMIHIAMMLLLRRTGHQGFDEYELLALSGVCSRRSKRCCLNRVRKLLADLNEAFWIIPFVMVLGGILAGVGLVSLDRSGLVPRSLIESPWLYNGGGTGALPNLDFALTALVRALAYRAMRRSRYSCLAEASAGRHTRWSRQLTGS